MKKVMVMFAAMAVAVFAQAASVDWTYTGSASEKDFTVFVFTSAIESNYKTYEDFIAGAIGSATVAEVGGRTGKSYSITGQTAGGVEGNTLYFAIIENSDATSFKYGSGDVSALAYNPENQESSKGKFGLTNASFAKSGTIGGTPTPPGPTPDVPEPTSGLLLVLGMAGLALRRKHA